MLYDWYVKKQAIQKIRRGVQKKFYAIFIKFVQLVLSNFELVCLFIKYALCFCSNVNKLQSFPLFLEMNINKFLESTPDSSFLRINFCCKFETSLHIENKASIRYSLFTRLKLFKPCNRVSTKDGICFSSRIAQCCTVYPLITTCICHCRFEITFLE